MAFAIIPQNPAGGQLQCVVDGASHQAFFSRRDVLRLFFGRAPRDKLREAVYLSSRAKYALSSQAHSESTYLSVEALQERREAA